MKYGEYEYYAQSFYEWPRKKLNHQENKINDQEYKITDYEDKLTDLKS